MTVTVVKAYLDLENDGILRSPGDSYEVGEERAALLVEKGFAVIKAEEKPEKTTKKASRKKAK